MKQTAPIIFNSPCLRCGKPIRADYMGFCMDCADTLGISEITNPGEATQEELQIIAQYSFVNQKDKRKGKKNVRIGRNNPRK